MKGGPEMLPKFDQKLFNQKLAAVTIAMAYSPIVGLGLLKPLYHLLLILI